MAGEVSEVYNEDSLSSMDTFIAVL